jgi:hypothetical protein
MAGDLVLKTWKIKQCLSLKASNVMNDIKNSEWICLPCTIYFLNKHSESIASNTKSPTGGIFHQNSSTKI